MKKKHKVILLIETSRSFGRQLQYGIARYSKSHGPWVFYKETGGMERSISQLKGWKADGIIMRNPRQYEELLALGLPTILVIHQKEYASGFPKITTHSKKIAKMAADHLLERGFESFAYCGQDEMFWSQERGVCFKEYLKRSGYDVHVYHREDTKSPRNWMDEQKVLVRWLLSLPKPIGIFSSNDDRAQHVIEACKQADLNVPEDIAIIGVDNDQLVCDLSDPPLTSISLDTEMAGYKAASMLDNMMSGQDWDLHEDIIVEPIRVVCRQSTDIMAMDDKDVAIAIRFIRDNCRKPIRVDDVADAAALSRRVLEKRFRKILNRTVHEEIRRVRIDQIIRLLTETDMSISEIARFMSFGGVEHIARYFRKETLMSPQAYRKNHGRAGNKRI